MAKIREKLVKKEEEIQAEIRLQELIANIQLLEDLSKRKSSIDGDMAALTRCHPEIEQALMDAIVPDFSIDDLALSLIPEDFVAAGPESPSIRSCPP